MTTTTKTVGRNPFQLSISNVSETLGQISLNRDLIAFLTRLGAVLRVTFDPSSKAPIIKVVNDKGNTLCSISEFEKLGGYRRIISDAVKISEKTVLTEKRVAITAKLMSLFEDHFKDKEIPQRISAKNSARKIELENTLKVLTFNSELLMELPDTGNYSQYVKDTIQAIEFVLAAEMIATIGDVDLTSENRWENIFLAGVPKFMYHKLTTKINLDIADLKYFLFPKNNFFKNISFTTKELRNSHFCGINEKVLENSHYLRQVVLMEDFLQPLDDIPKDKISVEQVNETIDQFMWPLHRGGPAAEVIQPRLEGKAPPLITLEKPKGKETEIPRYKRLVKHHLTKISCNILLLLNGVIITEDPCAQFWSHLYGDISSWEFSPSKTIFHWIVEADPEHKKFQEIVDFSNSEINKILIEILMMKCGRYDPAIKKKFSTELLKMSTKKFVDLSTSTEVEGSEAGEKESAPTSEESSVDKFKRILPPTKLKWKDILKVDTISTEQTEKAKRFLNVRKPIVAKKDQSFKLSRKLSKETEKDLLTLKNLVNVPFYNLIHEWVITTFPSGKGELLQQIAVDFILGAVTSQPEIIDPTYTDAEEDSGKTEESEEE